MCSCPMGALDSQTNQANAFIPEGKYATKAIVGTGTAIPWAAAEPAKSRLQAALLFLVCPPQGLWVGYRIELRPCPTLPVLRVYETRS